MDQPEFAAELYAGTASYYDRYRPGYPAELIDELVRRVAPSGTGRLLDLACGTGQLGFALRPHFAEVWAVDQEPGMVDVVAAKAAGPGGGVVRAMTAAAETLDAPDRGFELVSVGNAFHRLDRVAVASLIAGWLRPGGHLALCWSTLPWSDPKLAWERAFSELLAHWRAELDAGHPVPADWQQHRQTHPDGAVLAAAGFEPVARFEREPDHRWTLAELTGLVCSTSFLSAPVLGERAPEFGADLAARLTPYLREGRLSAPISFAVDLYRSRAEPSPAESVVPLE